MRYLSQISEECPRILVDQPYLNLIWEAQLFRLLILDLQQERLLLI